jgi:parallel beta-helix repeat protein
MRRLSMILMTFAFLPWSLASATIINVPGDYPTIQEGIDACSPGDTVIVADGIYHENITIGLAVSLFGQSRDGVVIDGSGAGDVVFIDSAMVSVGNLTVRNSGSQLTDSGIELRFADSCRIEYCRFNSNNCGLFLYGSRYNTISRCSFSSNENGIHFHESVSETIPDNRENNITNNIMQNNNSCGVFFDHTLRTYHDSNLISGNRILNNQIGISMIMSYRNNIMRNDIIDNDEYGIIHMVCEGGGGNNVFHHNNFYYNNQGDIQACNFGVDTDFWYSEIDEEGNYWSDYTGPDENGDGIGDIPYEVDGDSCQDIYPLMEPLYSIVSGCVSDGFDPIEGVYVEAIGTEIDDLTDYDGTYCLEGLGAGMFDIIFLHPDYCDTTVAGAPTTPGLITELSIVMDPETGIDEADSPLPGEFELVQNYPNPFNARTTIEYRLPYAGPVAIEIYDILGRKVETLVRVEQPAGCYRTTWNAEDRPSGIYLYRFQAGSYTEIKRILLIK